MWFPSLLGKYDESWLSVAQSHTFLWMGGKTQTITMFVSDLFYIYIKDTKWPNDMQSDNNKKVLKIFEKICRYTMLYLTPKDCCDPGNSAIFFRLLELARYSLSQISLLEEPTQKSFPTLNLSCSAGCSFKQSSNIAHTYITLCGYWIRIISHPEYNLWPQQNLNMSLSPCASFILIAPEGAPSRGFCLLIWVLGL